MPIMDDLEAPQRIRCRRDWATVPIVVLTANAFNENGARGLAVGMNDCIPKPFEPEQLLGTFAAWLPTNPKAVP